jgi:hypothetical protein
MQESGLRLIHEVTWVAEPGILARPAMLTLLTKCGTWTVVSTRRWVCWGFLLSSLRSHILLDFAAHLCVQVLAVFFKQLARDKREELGLLCLSANGIVHLANVLVCFLDSVIVWIFLRQLSVIKLFLGLSKVVVSAALVYVFAFLSLSTVEQLPPLLSVFMYWVYVAFEDLFVAQLTIKDNSASEL